MWDLEKWLRGAAQVLHLEASLETLIGESAQTASKDVAAEAQAKKERDRLLMEKFLLEAELKKLNKKLGIGGEDVTVAPPPEAAAVRSGTGGECCNRFQFVDGFLIDGKFGDAWRYDDKQNAFSSVFRDLGPGKKEIVAIVMDDLLGSLKEQYADEIARSISEKNRQEELATFDRKYLDPLRIAARIKKPD